MMDRWDSEVLGSSCDGEGRFVLGLAIALNLRWMGNPQIGMNWSIEV